MTVLQVCAFGAEHPGNFITSLEALEMALEKKGIRTIYAFVERAKDKEWCKSICRRTKVYFLPEARARILPKTYQIMRRIYKENDVDIVHTHFELYDIPATVTAPKKVQVFWHLHDPIVPSGGLRGILWKIQYGYVGKKAKLLAVASYYRDVAVSLGFPKRQTFLVLNGIDLNRVGEKIENVEPVYDFLTFGWDFARKGDDLIIQACDRLVRDGYRFKLLLNGNEHTWTQLDSFLDGGQPDWLIKGEPVEDVSLLFAQSKIFIQASRRETFSYAVCEAAYAGLPVIASDIPGLEWAHNLPSVRFFENENVTELYLIMKQYLNGRVYSVSDVNTSKEYIRNNLSVEAWTQNILWHYGFEV